MLTSTPLKGLTRAASTADKLTNPRDDHDATFLPASPCSHASQLLPGAHGLDSQSPCVRVDARWTDCNLCSLHLSSQVETRRRKPRDETTEYCEMVFQKRSLARLDPLNSQHNPLQLPWRQ